MGDRDDGRRIGFVFIILGILVWGIYIYILQLLRKQLETLPNWFGFLFLVSRELDFDLKHFYFRSIMGII